MIIQINNSFNSKVNGLYAYRFWFYNKCFTLKCEVPFVRGDIVELSPVEDNCANIKVVKLEEKKDIPTLVFFMTKTPVRKNSNYIPKEEQTENLIFKDTSVVEDNKWHAYGLIVQKHTTFTIKDTISKTEMDFLILTNKK